MTRFLRHRNPLGPLENTVMEILWMCGDCKVHDVIERLERPLAYTTVMTTLDRLFKKALLDRRKDERAFIYSPRLSRKEWEEKRAGDLVAGVIFWGKHLLGVVNLYAGGRVGIEDLALLVVVWTDTLRTLYAD